MINWLLLPLIPIVAGVWLSSFYLTPVRPVYDSAQYVAMAYNMANYNVSSMDESDNPGVKPDFFREPGTSFIYSIAMRLNRAFAGIPLACLLAEDMKCGSLLIYLEKINIFIFALTILAVYVGVSWVTSSKIFAFIAAMLVAGNTIFPSYIRVIVSEAPAAMFFTWHAVFLYGAFSGSQRLACAIGAGLSLAALVLTKAIYLYWVPCLALILVVAWLLAQKRHGRISAAACCWILVPAVLFSTGWMARNYLQCDKFAISDRAFVLLSIRADYTTVSWETYFSGFFYFTPYVGPGLAQKYFGDAARMAYDYNEPTALESPLHTNIVTRRLGRDVAPEVVQSEALRVIAENWVKQIALIPLMAYRGMFIGGCCNILANDVPPYWIPPPWALQGDWPKLPLIPAFNFLILVAYWTQAILAALLGPLALLFTARTAVRREWAVLLFSTPLAFHFMIHAVATHFNPRFSVPVYPVMVIMAVCFIAYFFDGRRGKYLKDCQ